jgi:hypothetical protein
MSALKYFHQAHLNKDDHTDGSAKQLDFPFRKMTTEPQLQPILKYQKQHPIFSSVKAGMNTFRPKQHDSPSIHLTEESNIASFKKQTKRTVTFNELNFTDTSLQFTQR